MNKLLQIEPCREHFLVQTVSHCTRESLHEENTDRLSFFSFEVFFFFFSSLSPQKMGDYIYGNNENTIMEKLKKILFT